MDKIQITDLDIDTVIGIYDWEQEKPQTLSFDLEIDCNINTAAISDHIDDTLDYSAITDTVVQFVKKSRYQLIEALAEAVCELLLASYPISSLTLTLSKPVALHGQNTAKIIITRSRLMASAEKRGYLLGIGSNINPESNIANIVDCLLNRFPCLTLSRAIKTLPVEMHSHNIFLNMVIFIETGITATALKATCNDIEVQLGRDRADPLRMIKDRPADLDILTAVQFPDDYNRPIQDITSERFLYPLLTELLGFLSGRQCRAYEPGVALTAGSLSFGQAATTIHRHTGASDKRIS